jgi:type VI secretion system protein ImpE
MTIEECVKQGDFEGALRLIARQIGGVTADPGLVLMAFNLEVRLQRFDAAERSIQRLLGLAPQLAGPMAELAGNASAEAKVAARLTDPVLAAKRKGIGLPPPHAFAHVQAAIHHAHNDHAAAAAALEDARQRTPSTAGTMTWRNGRTARFDHLVDSDDLIGPILPCYDDGSVLDLPYSQLRSIRFADPQTSFDTMWIPAEIVPQDGPPLRVKVPGFYSGSGVASAPRLRTGEQTIWNRERGYAVGLGQRDLIMTPPGGGVVLVGVLQVRSIELDPPASMAGGRRAPGPDKPKGLWKRLF